MFQWLEKWALRRLLKRVAEGIPVAQDRLAEIWIEHKDEILEAVKKAIASAVKKFIENKAKEIKAKVVDITASTN